MRVSKLDGISERWAEFRQTVLAEYADTTEIERIRPYFYAGAIAMLALFKDIPQDLPEETAAFYLECLDREGRDFFINMKCDMERQGKEKLQ